MKKLTTIGAALLIAITMASCSNLSGREIGLGTGAVAGAAIGSAVSGGSIGGAALGAAGGGAAGYYIGKGMEK